MEILRKCFGEKAIIVLFMVISATASYLLFHNNQTPKNKPTPVSKPTADPVRNFPAKKAILQEEKAIQKPERIFFRSFEPNDILAREVDIAKIEKITRNINSGTVDEQIEAIELLSKIGAQQQKDIIKSIAINPDKEIAVRLAAVENMDWEQNSDTIGSLILSQNEIVEPLIYMASEKELSEDNRNILDNAIYNVFFQADLLHSTQLAILNYFLERQSAHFEEIISQVNIDGYSPQEKEDFKNLWGAVNSYQDS